MPVVANSGAAYVYAALAEMLQVGAAAGYRVTPRFYHAWGLNQTLRGSDWRALSGYRPCRVD